MIIAHMACMALMAPGEIRPLTDAERAGLCPGLAEMLDAAGVSPRIVARPALPARIARLWRGSTPILAWGDAIFWPGAARDFSETRSMALLQHELQHVLDYTTGALTPLGYLLSPRNWTYRYRLHEGSEWAEFGAEQRAQIAEDYWRLSRGGGGDCLHHRRVLPWA